MTKLPGKTRRFPIPPNQPHRDRRNDYKRQPKHPKKDPEQSRQQ